MEAARTAREKLCAAVGPCLCRGHLCIGEEALPHPPRGRQVDGLERGGLLRTLSARNLGGNVREEVASILLLEYRDLPVVRRHARPALGGAAEAVPLWAQFTRFGRGVVKRYLVALRSHHPHELGYLFMFR